MQISFKGIEAIKGFEGFRKEAYRDTGGVWTIGYGTTHYQGKPVEAGQTVTEQEAKEALVADLAWAQTAVNQLVKKPLNQRMFDALVSFTYNVGAEAFRKSTLLKLLNEGKYREASNEFTRWKYDNGNIVPGLLKRRLVEQAMFNGT